MIVEDLKKLCYGGQLIEIVCKENYYYGRVRNIPTELFGLEVVCIGNSHTPNTLLVDAVNNTKE